MIMELNILFKIVKKRSGTIFSIILIFFLLGAVFTFSQPLKYRSRTRLLIIQNISADPYTVSKSNQYLSNLFSEVIYSSSFFDLASNNNQFSIDKNYFSGNYKNQMKTWTKTVEAKSTGDTGIMEINVYHQNPVQAKQISLAINNTLMTESFNYQGNNQSQIKFNVIDQPIISDYPVKPNIIANLGSSLIFGFIFSILYVYMFPSRKEKIAKQIASSLGHKRIATQLKQTNLSANSPQQTNNNISYEKISEIDGAYRPSYLYGDQANLPITKNDDREAGNYKREDDDNNEFEVHGNISNILK